ncbi:MAG TPA: hypothetical protein VGI63_02630 [Verrucomicrobiae bacterium]|jgi:hypothetical protein
MSEQLPAPDFDAHNYARPNQNWICGNACNGNACRQGPDAKGNCCANTECKPVLKIKPGETKGRWICTRQGGECESGPLPNGSCCRPIAKCSPVPTLRLVRGRLTLAVVAASCAVLLVILGIPPWRNHFINPGTISEPHSGAAFAALAETNHLNQSCGACHVAGSTGPNGMVNAALRAEPGILDLRKLALAKPEAPTVIDESCLKCHAGRNIHQPSAPPISCAFCHAEHQGKVMAATTDANCNFCHGDAAKMAVAPKTPMVHHFAEDHPQFKFITEKLRDADTLKFNHALHLAGATIPKLPGGEKLECAFCHQPDAAGAFMKPVAFGKNCRVCHSLQFDPETPQLQLPHGSAEFVSAYLRSLPKQYLDLAVKENSADANSFVREKLSALRTQSGSGEDLERRIFFSTATAGPAASIGTLSGATRAVFPGCAYCHEVKAADSGSPQVTKPFLAERWLAQAKFNHAKHIGISCEKCHDAVHSKDTADILLPAKEICAECHSPLGGVADSCAECHTYHKPLVVAR